LVNLEAPTSANIHLQVIGEFAGELAKFAKDVAALAGLYSAA